MGRNCAVASCKSWYGGRTAKANEDGKKYFKFPKDKTTLALWIAKCKRADSFNPATSSICSDHFSTADYDPHFLLQQQLMPDRFFRPTLRPDAVPSLNLPSTSSSSCDKTKEERAARRTTKKAVQEVVEQHALQGPSSLENDQTRKSVRSSETRRLKKQIKQLLVKHQADRLRWLREKTRLQRKISELRKHIGSSKLQVESVLSKQQVKRLVTGRRTHWSPGDVSKAIGLRAISRKAYGYVQDAMKIPLPSCSTLSRWTRSFQIESGVIDAALWVLKPAVEAMDPLERIAGLTFDEMALNSRPTYDQSADTILAGSKLQLMMVRGLVAPWKQPIFYELDAPVTQAKLHTVILALENIGLDIRAVTTDMFRENESLWKGLGVDYNKTWISNPANPDKKLWVFADTPHLVKLIRSHVVKDDGGLTVEDGEGGEVLLDAAPFRQLRALDGAEKRICPKLTDQCIEAKGQTAQRVRLATRLFSSTVAAAMETVLKKHAVARAIRIIDKWFDVLNSRCPTDAKVERHAFGYSETVMAAQEAALKDMERLIAKARKKTVTVKPGQTPTLLPFQRGILRNSASVRGLYQDLKSAYPERLRFLMTTRVNQDCLENVFSQLRSMCGQNTHPDAVEVRQRLRILLMAPSALRAISCPERAVEAEGGPDFLTAGVAPPPGSDSVSGAALDGLDILFVDQDEVEAVEMDHAYATCQPDQTVPTDDLGVQRSGLAFIAGYIASKMRHVDPTLGCRTADASPALLASVPSAWLTTISRGSLHVPASWWVAVVEDFDAQFCTLMGPTFCRKAKVIERLVQIISRRRPELDLRVARRLARVRLHLRVSWLRQKLVSQRADRRAQKQLRQHMASQR